MQMSTKLFTGFAALAMSTTATAVSAKPFPAMPDQSTITVNGTVTQIKDDEEFVLDYGTGTVTVETEDAYQTLYDEGMADRLVVGESVTVGGWIDDDVFEGREIKAHTVVKNASGTVYSMLDMPDYVVAYTYPLEGRISLYGTVTDIEGTEEFTMDYGTGTVEVETEGMLNNPLEAGAVNPLLVGESVYVTGWLEDGIFEDRELDAYSVSQLEYLETSAN